MAIRKQYIESLVYAIISELDQSNEKKIKLYNNLYNVINSEIFYIQFDEVGFSNNNTSYNSVIIEYKSCFENKNHINRNRFWWIWQSI
jgi:hypothetical protein